jgi:hypothetical protein
MASTPPHVPTGRSRTYYDKKVKDFVSNFTKNFPNTLAKITSEPNERKRNALLVSYLQQQADMYNQAQSILDYINTNITKAPRKKRS